MTTERRRWLARVLAGWFLLTAVGFPAWTAAVPRRAGDTFPCEGNRCGCETARECWTSCCCTTPSERLAWARDRGIDLPRSVHRQLVANSQTTPPTSCCSKHHAGPPQDTRPVEGEPAVGRRQCHGEPMTWCCLAPAILPQGQPALSQAMVTILSPPNAGCSTPVRVPESPPPQSCTGTCIG